MISIEYNESVTSTNDLANECEKEWTIFIAEKQTKARGQRGNSWESEEGKNLTFSLVIKPQFMEASEQFYISKAVSLAIVYTLEDLDIAPKIKWPNDIYVGDKKICGILIENILSSSGGIQKSVIGVGLNINQQTFISDAPNPISIYNILGQEQNRNEILNGFALHFNKLYNILACDDFETIDKEYKNYLYRYNEPHRFKDCSGEFTGTIVDVLTQGELIVEKENSSKNSYLFKEVEYVIE
ncbi:MAG: biotin--[acetyl-CoA-carboxylase] ligase [Rikenellaceae bacterium]